ncbi:hypothetical protein [Acetobacter indonesiensis]|uniref:hypothetical protein n=1 Tax=Acetobacter indonesiensis TaxID=104101 RepID=UPI0039E8AD94
MAEKVLSAYERAVDDGLFNTDCSPNWAVRDIQILEARCIELEHLRKRFQTEQFPIEDVQQSARIEQDEILNAAVEALVGYVKDIHERVQLDNDLTPQSRSDYRREMAECA